MTTLKQIIDEAKRLHKEFEPCDLPLKLVKTGEYFVLEEKNGIRRAIDLFDSDAKLWAHLTNHLPTLIAQVEKLRSTLDEKSRELLEMESKALQSRIVGCLVARSQKF